MKTIPHTEGFSVVIPALNEASAIGETITALTKSLAFIHPPHEIIVVDDGSSDNTAESAKASGAAVLRHPTNYGYGSSLLTGIEAAQYDTIVIIDADGTYPAEELPALLDIYDRGYHMLVGARQGKYFMSSLSKSILRMIFRWLAEFTCGRSIPDINSGFRIFDRRPVLQWRESLSSGFSFTTTITLLFMLKNLRVGYTPITYHKRVGQSKVRLLRDSLRSLQIILTAIAQFNPLKLYILLAGFNALGNALIFAGLYVWLWPIYIFYFCLLVWNMAAVLAGIAIIAVGLLKPA